MHFSEKAMAPLSSSLAWRIPWTEEPGRLPSMGLHRVGHDWSDLAAAAAYAFLCINTQVHGTTLADFVLSIQGAQVQSLVGERRFCMPSTMAKKRKLKYNEIGKHQAVRRAHPIQSPYGFVNYTHRRDGNPAKVILLIPEVSFWKDPVLFRNLKRKQLIAEALRMVKFFERRSLILTCFDRWFPCHEGNWMEPGLYNLL